SWWCQGDCCVNQESGRSGCASGCSHHPHQRLLCAEPFRRNGSRLDRRSPCRRTSSGSGHDNGRADSRQGARIEGLRDPRGEWIAMKAQIRKIAVFLEETRTEMGRSVIPPTRRAAAVAVIENPYAGRYVEDLSDLMDIGEELGELLTQRALSALGIPASKA